MSSDHIKNPSMSQKEIAGIMSIHTLLLRSSNVFSEASALDTRQPSE